MGITVNIKKQLKGFLLQVDFQSQDSPLAILGVSGSGKSMTLKCIAGIETPDEGYIESNGKVLFSSKDKINLKPQQRDVGYLFQNYALFPHMTVKKNIAVALKGTKEEKESKITTLLNQLNISELAEKYPRQLSGGQQQRVALARILAYSPDLLLLDEPFSALDSHLKESLQMDMKEFLKSYQKNAIMVTHSRSEAYQICDDLLILDQGKVQDYGEIKSLFFAPTKLITAQLTGCKNFSAAKKISHNQVLAIDWDTVITVSDPIPENLSHIGVRAHFFTPWKKSYCNAIPVHFYKEIDAPFEKSILFFCGNTHTKKNTIWWKVSKQNLPTSYPDTLYVPPEQVLLLTI